MPRPPRLVLALLTLVAGASVLVPVGAEARPAVPAPVGSDPWRAGQDYRGDFPDPSVLRAGRSYYAYSTSVAGLNLPVLTSTDLASWRAAAPMTGPVTVDAMPAVAAWAYSRQVGARRVGINWAPSVARVHGRYVAAYATRMRGSSSRMCISVAVSARPRGPFVDRSTAPLVCPGRGAIDPQIYLEHGKPWLLYKTEDIAAGRPTRLWVRRLSAYGTRFPAWSKRHKLLTASMAWERSVVENPAMIRFKGRRYLFYSGNGWGRPGYAIGYAVCRSVTGPCARVVEPGAHQVHGVPQSVPLLRSGSGIRAPGGGSPIVTPAGRLRLAYHAWDAGFSRYPTTDACRETARGCAQRKLHVARLHADGKGRLSVVDRG